VAAVAFSQNESCRPQTRTAKSGGSHAVRVVSNQNGAEALCLCSCVRSCASNATERARSPIVSAAQTAANRFSARGRMAGESQRIGYVSNQVKGENISGRQSQPSSLAMMLLLGVSAPKE